MEALEKNAFDHGKDTEKFKEDLINIAKTTLSSAMRIRREASKYSIWWKSGT